MFTIPRRPASPVQVKAGPLGPGAGPLMSEYLLPSMLPTNHARKMKTAWSLGQTVGYVFAAERVISGRVSSMPWHLEDQDGETIDDEYADARAVEAYTLLSSPMAAIPLREVGTRRTSRQTLEVTSRHMGLCGTTFWYLDQINTFGIPRAIIYVRPDRITPKTGSDDILVDWRLDAGKQGNYDGTALSVDEVLPMYLQTPNEGYIATGLVEAALLKIQLNPAFDKHILSVLSGGGRLSGILAPKEGAITDDNIYKQLVADWRNIAEQPESAKRLQVVRSPVDFIRTTATPQEMRIADLMERNRDDLIALWGVPYSQIGGSPAAGLNGGEARGADKQSLHENAVHPRLQEIAEAVQTGLLDRWELYIGWAPRFVWDEPSFDSQESAYTNAQSAVNMPLRNWERRAIVGLDPFGPEVKGIMGVPLDDEIWTPNTIVVMGAAPEGGYTPPEPEPVPLQDAEDDLQNEEMDEGSPKAQRLTYAQIVAGYGRRPNGNMSRVSSKRPTAYSPSSATISRPGSNGSRPR